MGGGNLTPELFSAWNRGLWKSGGLSPREEFEMCSVLRESQLDQNRLDGSRVAADAHHPCGILIWDSSGTLVEFTPLIIQVVQNPLYIEGFHSYQHQTKKIITVLSSSITFANPHILHPHNKPCLLLMAEITPNVEVDSFPKVASHHCRPPARRVVILCVFVCDWMSSRGGRQVPWPHKNTLQLFPSVPPLTFLSHVLSALLLHEELCLEKHVPQLVKLSHDSGIQRKMYPAVLISQMTTLLTTTFPCFPYICL